MIDNIRELSTYIANLHYKYEKYKDIIVVEHRSNNPKRDYLFVNKIQAKHIPCNPCDMLIMCNDLAYQVNKKLHNKYKNILVIGFAETATAIAYRVATQVQNVKYIMCTTREAVNKAKTNAKDLVLFEEEHSHATTQILMTWRNNNLQQFDYILFVEDEISTGKTIMNCVEKLKDENIIDENIHIGVVSVCNWQNENNKKIFDTNNIDTFSLIAGELNNTDIKMNIQADSILDSDKQATNKRRKVEVISLRGLDIFNKFRLGQSLDEHLSSNAKLIQKIQALDVLKKFALLEHKGKFRIVGTEECMQPSILIGTYLSILGHDVLCHSTTRSKIDIIKGGYGLLNRYEVASAYADERRTYIYNTGEYTDAVIIVTDSNVNAARKRFIHDISNIVNTNEIIAININ